jgi:hypothetical protein
LGCLEEEKNHIVIKSLNGMIYLFLPVGIKLGTSGLLQSYIMLTNQSVALYPVVDRVEWKDLGRIHHMTSAKVDIEWRRTNSRS